MEENRLKPWGEYDEAMFNRLYHRVTPLKKKLASQINPHRLNVEYADICAFFDIKIAFVFQKHHHEFDEDRLLGYIINSLKLFKYRILRVSYSKKYLESPINFEEDLYHLESAMSDELSEEEIFRKEALLKIDKFFKKRLDEPTYYMFKTLQNLPPYLLKKCKPTKKPLPDIPEEALADYLGLPNTPKVIKYLKNQKDEIFEVFNLAVNSFSK
jgi:hypothetical protein